VYSLCKFQNLYQVTYHSGEEKILKMTKKHQRNASLVNKSISFNKKINEINCTDPKAITIKSGRDNIQ